MRRLAAALVLLILTMAPVKAATIFAAVTINGYPTGLIVSLDQQGERLTATPADLDRIGIIVPGALTNQPRVDLSALPGIRFHFHADTQTLAIDAETTSLKTHLIGDGAETELPDEAAYGALLNYGFAFTAATKGAAQASGNLELRAFGPPGIFESNWYTGPVGDDRSTQFRRLDTAFIHDDAQALQTWTVGDFISASLPWSRPVRAAGFSLATDFAVQPNLITQPMPWLQGTASVPSTIDLYLDGVHQLSEPAPPGPFAITQAPMVNGEGEVSLAVTDALGRQTMQSFSFYASDQLLAPGLMSYALEAGWLRENFAATDDRYTDPFAQGLIQRGMNDWLTLEARAAGTRDVTEIGAGLVAKLGEFAVAGISLDDSGFGEGQQLRVSIERQTKQYYLLLAAQQSFGRFRDVASAVGDIPIERSIQVGAGWNSDSLGIFGLNYYEQKAEHGNFVVSDDVSFDKIAIFAASWSHPIFNGWTVYATAYRSADGSHTSGFMVGLTVSPDEGLVVDGGVSGSNHRIGAFADASQSPPNEGGWGWNAQAQTTPSVSGQGVLRYVSPIGEVGAGVSADSSETVGSAYVLGSVAWLAGGNPRLARQSGQSFAEVDTGEPGIGVTLENRNMGVTGSDGRLLVPDLVAFTDNHFAIAPDTVPLSQEIVTSSAIARPPRDAGVIVNLRVQPNRSAAVRFVRADGNAVAMGAAITLNGQSQGSIGYDGVAWLSGLAPDNQVIVGDGDQACTAEFRFDPSTAKPGVQIGPVICIVGRQK